MMPIRAVIFDFGGVLVRTEDWSGHHKWETHLGLPQGELAKIVFDSEISKRAALGQVAVPEIWEHVGTTLNLTPAQVRELKQDFWSGEQLDEELLSFLGSLRPLYKTAILSNAWLDAREAFTQIYKVGRAVDIIIISAEEGLAKPDPQLFELAASRLEVQPDEAVFVDDFVRNVEAARSIGMKGVLFENTTQAIAEVQNYLDG